VLEFVLQPSPANLIENALDSTRHIRLFDLGFNKKRNRGVADLDEFAADRPRNSVVLIGQQSNQRSDLTIARDHYSPNIFAVQS